MQVSKWHAAVLDVVLNGGDEIRRHPVVEAHGLAGFAKLQAENVVLLVPFDGLAWARRGGR